MGLARATDRAGPAVRWNGETTNNTRVAWHNQQPETPIALFQRAAAMMKGSSVGYRMGVFWGSGIRWAPAMGAMQGQALGPGEEGGQKNTGSLGGGAHGIRE